MHRSGGKSSISFRRLLPGYVIVDTNKPEVLDDMLQNIPRLTRLEEMLEDEGGKAIYSDWKNESRLS